MNVFLRAVLAVVVAASFVGLSAASGDGGSSQPSPLSGYGGQASSGSESKHLSSGNEADVNHLAKLKVLRCRLARLKEQHNKAQHNIVAQSNSIAELNAMTREIDGLQIDINEHAWAWEICDEVTLLIKAHDGKGLMAWVKKNNGALPKTITVLDDDFDSTMSTPLVFAIQESANIGAEKELSEWLKVIAFIANLKTISFSDLFAANEHNICAMDAAVHYSVKKSKEIVEILLNAGWPVDGRGSPCVPLLAAAQFFRTDVMTMLLGRVNTTPLLQGVDGKNILHHLWRDVRYAPYDVAELERFGAGDYKDSAICARVLQFLMTIKDESWFAALLKQYAKNETPLEFTKQRYFESWRYWEDWSSNCGF